MRVEIEVGASGKNNSNKVILLLNNISKACKISKFVPFTLRIKLLWFSKIVFWTFLLMFNISLRQKSFSDGQCSISDLCFDHCCEGECVGSCSSSCRTFAFSIFFPIYMCLRLFKTSNNFVSKKRLFLTVMTYIDKVMTTANIHKCERYKK